MIIKRENEKIAIDLERCVINIQPNQHPGGIVKIENIDINCLTFSNGIFISANTKAFGSIWNFNTDQMRYVCHSGKAPKTHLFYNEKLDNVVLVDID